MPSTGHKVQDSGIYESRCCRKRQTFNKGRKFPPCSKCKKGAEWVLAERTSAKRKKKGSGGFFDSLFS